MERNEKEEKPSANYEALEIWIKLCSFLKTHCCFGNSQKLHGFIPTLSTPPEKLSW